ncbi:MAG: hypothetical protein ACRDSP_09300 [Pseudonocardiaceae bacterium]
MPVGPPPGTISPATARGGARWSCLRPAQRATQDPRTGEAASPVQQDSPTHRVVLIVEVDESAELSPADLVAMADVLREAAAELAPQGTTRASVELGVTDPAPRASASGEGTTPVRTA